MKHARVIFFSIGLLFMGCDDPVDQEETRESLLNDASVATLSADSAPSGDFLDEVNTITEITRSASDWKEADRRIQEYLESNSSSPKLVQLASRDMLSRFFTKKDDLGSTEKERLAFYTKQLVDNSSPEAKLIHSALMKLQGYWPARRIKSAADSTIEAATQTYASGSSDDELPGDLEKKRANQNLEGVMNLKEFSDSIDIE